jgi:uncharacterized UBP type Zn finger protein
LKLKARLAQYKPISHKQRQGITPQGIKYKRGKPPSLSAILRAQAQGMDRETAALSIVGLALNGKLPATKYLFDHYEDPDINAVLSAPIGAVTQAARETKLNKITQ